MEGRRGKFSSPLSFPGSKDARQSKGQISVKLGELSPSLSAECVWEGAEDSEIGASTAPHHFRVREEFPCACVSEGVDWLVAELQLLSIPPKQGHRLKTASLAKVQGGPRDYVQSARLLMMMPWRKWETEGVKEGEEKPGKIKSEKRMGVINEGKNSLFRIREGSFCVLN
ncbi:hypothetical protein E2C01_059477 [Portunus trituberculatus]|uniref:Uncharacterized protein n=1 Tax=Portunus trituberculatus TaxID=210409 RepID=A0A5B7H5G5_PORTR|nr:hypothetical protein [Portunus trituberculatus]